MYKGIYDDIYIYDFNLSFAVVLVVLKPWRMTLRLHWHQFVAAISAEHPGGIKSSAVCELVDGFNSIPPKNEWIIISGMRAKHVSTQQSASGQQEWFLMVPGFPRVYPWSFGDYSCTYGMHLAWVEHARSGFVGS